MILKDLSLEDFNQVADTIKEEYETSESNFLDFRTYYPNMVGIYVDNQVVGIMTTSPFVGQTSINIYILSKYRGKNYAGMATQMFVEQFGALYKDSPKFLINISPNNKKSLKVAEKLGWKQNFDYDEDLLNEGAEYFYVFEYPNPYYAKTNKR